MSIKDRLRQVAGRPISILNPTLMLPKSLEGWKDHRMRYLAVAILRLEHNKGSNRDLKALILFNQEVISACQNGQYKEVNIKLDLLRNHMRSIVANRKGRGKGLQLLRKGEIDASLGNTLEEQLRYLEEHQDFLLPTIFNKYRRICEEVANKK